MNAFRISGYDQQKHERVPLLQIVLSHKPRIFYFPNFFRHNDTMEYLARLSAGKLKDSVLDGERHNPSVRNSKVALQFMVTNGLFVHS